MHVRNRIPTAIVGAALAAALSTACWPPSPDELGECVNHLPWHDQDPCTRDSCDPVTGEVVHAPVDVDDADACTADACDPTTGAVTHLPVPVDDANPCTVDACDPATGDVTHLPVTPGGGDACSTATCDPATGQITWTPVPIDDADACTLDACDPATGGISHSPVPIDDADACTTDACDAATGTISHVPDATCGAICSAVDDENACTTDVCDPGTGTVTHTPANVDDGNACTADACDPTTGTISHLPVTVDDAIACTVDSCDPATGVAHAPDDSLCTVPGETCSPTSGCVAPPTAEVSWCQLNTPPSLLATAGAATGTVTGWVLALGVTDAVGQGAGILAAVGYGPVGSDPAAGYTWFGAGYVGDRQGGLSDAYRTAMVAPAIPGTYDYLVRVTGDAGVTWTYCDVLGVWDPTAPFPGVLTVSAP